MPDEAFWDRLWRHIEDEYQYDWSQETRFEEFERAVHLLRIDPRPAREELKALAAQGSIASAELLGQLYLTGEETPIDIEQAERWHRHAARIGSVKQTHRLGRFYLMIDRPEDAARAFEKAAGTGFVPSMILLAVLLTEKGTAQHNPKRARLLLRQAISAGSTPAKLVLGTALLRQWYNPLNFMRGMWLVQSALPDVMVIVASDERPTLQVLKQARRDALRGALFFGLMLGMTGLWIAYYLTGETRLRTIFFSISAVVVAYFLFVGWLQMREGARQQVAWVFKRPPDP